MGYNKLTYYGRTIFDLTGDTAIPAHVLAGDIFHGADGDEATGTMANKGAISGTISTVAGAYTVPAGYHNGSGTVGISPAEQAKIIAGNIAKGVTILGVVGTYVTPVSYQEKTVTPSASAQDVVADTGYDALSKVIVAAVPYAEADNSAGGITVTIG